MNTFILKNTSAASVTTDVRFYVASERSLGKDIMRFSVSDELPEEKRQKLLDAAQKVLRAMKKQGKIQLFATLSDFTENTTAAQYLMNKYPDTEFYREGDDLFAVVRI